VRTYNVYRSSLIDLGDRETDLPAFAGLSKSIEYECRSESGAILALKDGQALSERLDPGTIRGLKKHLVKELSLHLETCGQDQGASVTVVTGTVTTGDYQAMVVSSQERSGSLNFGGGVECLVNGELGVKFRRSSSQSIYHTSGHNHRKDSEHCKGHGQCANEKSQCIFVNLLVARKRSLIGGVKFMKAAARPREFKKDEQDDSESDDTPVATSDDDSELDDEEHRQNDLFEEISDFIFEVGPTRLHMFCPHLFTAFQRGSVGTL
jgi:hypothetical protein